MGIGAAMIFPATLAIIINVFTDIRERAMAIGIWSGVTGLAVAAGPVTGGCCSSTSGGGRSSWSNIPIALVALVAGRLLIPTRATPARWPGPMGLVLSIAAVAAMVWAVIEAPHRGWTSAEIVITGTTGLLLLAAFVVHELRTSYPAAGRLTVPQPTVLRRQRGDRVAFFGLFGSSS